MVPCSGYKNKKSLDNLFWNLSRSIWVSFFLLVLYILPGIIPGNTGYYILKNILYATVVATTDTVLYASMPGMPQYAHLAGLAHLAQPGQSIRHSTGTRYIQGMWAKRILFFGVAAIQLASWPSRLWQQCERRYLFISKITSRYINMHSVRDIVM